MILPLFLLGLSLIYFSEADMDYENCGAKAVTNAYLDMAQEMINKGKANYPSCESHHNTKVPVPVCLLCLSMIDSIKADRNTSNHPVKGITDPYLDIAHELISKAKASYPRCDDSDQTNRSISSVKPSDCEEILSSGKETSGVYTVWPKNRVSNGKPLEVFCDMDTEGGGWTVIQRRGNYSRPKNYFFRDWQSYKSGFGDIEQDFWLGNDNIVALSNQKLYSVRFDLKDVEGNTRNALYDTFWIDDENHKYNLHIAGYSGDAGDSMSGHSNKSFSTKDRDNDNSPKQNCAEVYKGGWWYGACHSANLNGLYLGGKHDSFADGVEWKAWKGYYESLDTVEIKLRSKDFTKILPDMDSDMAH